MPICHYEERLPASFKGVPFPPSRGGSEHGRRGAQGEFPFAEHTAYLDMGIKIRKYTLTAWFAGPSHISRTQALIDACESPGPGTLVHPTRGVITCGCSKCETSEEYIDGDCHTLVDLEFIEAQANGLSLLTPSGVSIDSSVSFLLNFISSSWDATAVPFFSQPQLVATAADAIGAVANGVQQATRGAGGTRILSILSDCDLARADQHSLKSGPNIASLFSDAFSAIDLAGQQPAQTAALTKIANFAAAPSGQRIAAAAAMENALMAVLRALCAAYLARAAQAAPTTTLDKALARIQAIQTLISEEIAGSIASCDNGFALQMRQLFASTIPPLFSQAYLSPPLVTYQLNGSVPSLVAAWEIYGDARKFGAVETMNPFSACYAIGPKVFATKQ